MAKNFVWVPITIGTLTPVPPIGSGERKRAFIGNSVFLERMRRGQSSVELITIVAIALVILGVLVSLVSEQIAELQHQHAVKTAEASVKKLVENANEVYTQGAGATRQVLVTWPEGVVANHTYILNHSMVVHVGGTDIVGETKPVITGALPVNGGLQTIRLKAFDGFVAIGSVSLAVNPSTVFSSMGRDQNASTRLTMTNGTSNTGSLIFSTDWNHSLVDLNLSSSSGSIGGGGTYYLDVNAHTHSTAVGAYAGKLTIQATFPDRVETLIVPITIQVSTAATGNISVYPTSITVNTFGADTNSTSIQVCNTGPTPLKSVSFTPSSGTPGDWVQGISTLSSLGGLSCETISVTVSVPEGTALGSSSGSLLIRDFTGTHSALIPVSVNVQGMSSVFLWDWSTASIAQGQVSGFTLSNNGTKAVQINSMTIRNWWKCDLQKGNLTTIVANSVQRFSGSVSDGNVADVTDFNIPVLTSWLSNTLTFNASVNDDNESFIADVNFSDGTSYTTSTFGPGCGGDFTAPARVSDLNAVPGPDPRSVTLNFTFPGDDNFSGKAVGAVFKRSGSDITTDTQFNNATTIPYVGTISTGGTAGSFTVTDLNLAAMYYFAVKFYDENGNYGPLSNVPSQKPWNHFSWSGNDFNFSNAAYTSSLTSQDVNKFRVHNVSGTLSGARMVMRIYDQTNASNTWITALDFNSTHLTRIRIWYPLSSETGVPASTPSFDQNYSTTVGSSFNLLSSSLIPSNYRYNGSAVSNTLPNLFFMDYVSRIGDFNIEMDGDYPPLFGGG